MINKFTGKVSYIILTFFIAAIIVSFALTGFQGFGSSAGTVAKVDGEPVTIREYNQIVNQEIQRYSKIFGKDLTAQQIRQFRIKESALRNLIQQQLMANFAAEIGIDSGAKEVKERIKSLPYFQTNGQFDVRKYKALLAGNQLNPATFEEMIKEEASLEKLQKVLGEVKVSKASAEETLKMKNAGAKVSAASFDKEENTKYLDISNKEVSEFLKEEKNVKLAKSLFENMKSEFNKPAQLKASHILIPAQDKEGEKKIKAIRKKVNARNFAEMARKESKGPSAKKGGDLGWFEKGSMVPEFEKVAFDLKKGEISRPVKTQFGWHIILLEDKKPGVNKSFEDVKDIVVKRHLQKAKREELKAFNDKLVADIKSALEKGNTSKLDRLAKKYGVKLQKDVNLSFFNNKAGSISFKPETVAPIANGKEGVYVEDNPIDVKIVKVESAQSDKELKKLVSEKLEKESESLNAQLSNEARTQLVKKLEEDANIVTYPNLL